MNKQLCVVLLISCMIIISCGEKNTSSEGKMEEGTMEYFIKALDLKVAGEYKDILADRKHKGDRVAPDVIRAFVEGIEITRFSFKQGVKFQNGKATLWWFISHFGAKGKREKVMATIQNVFETHGFGAQEPTEDENGWKEFSFVKETDKMDYIIKMKELDRFIGSKEPKCGGDLICDITYNSTVEQPTVARVVEFYPQIACPELPAEVFDYLKEKKIEHMSYGGTWEHYYIWGVSIPAGDEKEAETMLNDVVRIIEKLDYSLWKDEGGSKTYQRKGTGGEASSFMDIEIEENNLFRLHFQLRS